MTDDGVLSFKEEMVGKRVRKYYYLTEKGQKEAVNYIRELQDFIATINLVVFPKPKVKVL
jgi:DNA-binding PadR family transcriptional regulator